ncbi:MAG: uracil-DNA glycosylase [Rhodospirillaceae bacterium]|nr:uracil-DNA glycosylase [Rhodospirillaceae bacterium]MYH35654.1 uracil-DNA glycosylase [Rhodospirillaceae bacterium]MYK15514.1 uracil-DNA glycosylase [Rhodospirillaceae bacterium]
MAAPDTPGDTPGRDCALCPRLAAFRSEWRIREPAWHNAPVPSFGGIDARLLIVGLAPGLRGANRTGRPFTGDWAGDLLYDTLIRYGFASGTYDRRRDDELVLADCRITNAVRCVPPENRPATAESRACLPFLAAEISGMPQLKAILALGVVAHGMALAAIGLRKSAFAFRHGAFHPVNDRLVLADSYHCSRYNTNTGRLTPEMFRAVFAEIRARLD